MKFPYRSIRKSLNLSACIIVVSTTSACTKDQVMRITYETLRQHDCHMHSLRTGYCDRSYALEYDQYKQVRKRYFMDIKSITEPDTIYPAVSVVANNTPLKENRPTTHTSQQTASILEY